MQDDSQEIQDSPRAVDVEGISDIDALRNLYRELEAKNKDLKSVMADDRQRLQTVEFKHRESIDQVAMLKSQKAEYQKQLEQSQIKRQLMEENGMDSVGDYDDDFDSDTSNEDAEPKKPQGKIAKLKDEIEDLQLALAEERMLGMQLDYSNRQSAQRADTLQYQLAEEKLKNMHLQSSHQQLQLDNSNSSGFVHLRDSNGNEQDMTNNDNNNNNNNNTNNSNDKKSRHSNKQNRNKKKRDDDEDSTASDLSREFDLKIEEDAGDEDVKPEEEARDLRHKLLEEQFKTEELKHRHRKSELELIQYKEELDDLRNKYDNEKQNYLDPSSAEYLQNESNQNQTQTQNTNTNQTETQLAKQERLKYESEIAALKDKLDISKKKTQNLDKKRRDSLNIMSKNFFAKQLKAAQATHSLEENLQSEIEMLKGQIYDITKSKIVLLQATNKTINQLRDHIVELSNRLRKYEKWDLNGNSDTNGTDDSYDVTDL